MADAEDEAGGGAPVPIHENLLQEILLSGASHETRANPQALALTSVLVRSFVEECWHRSAAEAEEAGDAEIKEEHLEKILPQLLLDFGP